MIAAAARIARTSTARTTTAHVLGAAYLYSGERGWWWERGLRAGRERLLQMRLRLLQMRLLLRWLVRLCSALQL